MLGLNPCFVGMWSFSAGFEETNKLLVKGLNPCFVGMWSFSPFDEKPTADKDMS